MALPIPKRGSLKGMFTDFTDPIKPIITGELFDRNKQSNTLNRVPISGDVVSTTGKGEYTGGLEKIPDSRTTPSPSIMAAGTKTSTPSFFSRATGKVSDFFKNIKAPQISQEQVDGIVPYLSNIATTFRRTPTPVMGKLVEAAAPRSISLNAARTEAEQTARGGNIGADMSLAENQAAAVRLASNATLMRGLSSIAEQEANANAQLGAQSDQVQLQADMYNAGVIDRFNQDKIAAQIATQNRNLSNIANFSDKYMEGVKYRDLKQLEKDKLTVASRMYEGGAEMREVLKGIKEGIYDPNTVTRIFPHLASRKEVQLALQEQELKKKK